MPQIDEARLAQLEAYERSFVHVLTLANNPVTREQPLGQAVATAPMFSPGGGHLTVSYESDGSVTAMQQVVARDPDGSLHDIGPIEAVDDPSFTKMTSLLPAEGETIEAEPTRPMMLIDNDLYPMYDGLQTEPMPFWEERRAYILPDWAREPLDTHREVVEQYLSAVEQLDALRTILLKRVSETDVEIKVPGVVVLAAGIVPIVRQLAEGWTQHPIAQDDAAMFSVPRVLADAIVGFVDTNTAASVALTEFITWAYSWLKSGAIVDDGASVRLLANLRAAGLDYGILLGGQ